MKAASAWCSPALMILIFLGNMRATVAVMLSIPLSALAAFLALNARWRHHQHDGAGRPRAGILAPDRQLRRRAGKHFPPSGDGRVPRSRCRKRRPGSGLPVLAATFTTAIVFFPVVFLYGVSRFLFTALAARGGALTVCFVRSRDDGGPALLREVHQDRRTTRQAHHPRRSGCFERFVRWFNRSYDRLLDALRHRGRQDCCVRPAATVHRHPRHLSFSALRCIPSWACRFFRAPTPASSSSTSRPPPARASK